LKGSKKKKSSYFGVCGFIQSSTEGNRGGEAFIQYSSFMEEEEADLKTI
jgi:hypothetical protein